MELKDFQLVLVHGLADTVASRARVKEFWSTRFPKALVSDIAFLTEAPLNLLERALAVLRQIKHDKETELRKQYTIQSEVDTEKVIPCVFLCHELGSALVKQALLLASQDTRYAYLTADVARIVCCDTPTQPQDALSWERRMIHLISSLEVGSWVPISLLRGLPTALSTLSSRFKAIEKQYSIVNIGTDDRDPWSFETGVKTTERIFDNIYREVKQKRKETPQQLWNFLQTLSKIDPKNYQLELQEPFEKPASRSLLNCVTDHDLYESWIVLDSEKPNILCIHGAQENSSTILASALFFELQDTIQNALVVSYSFNKRDWRTQSIETFCTSLSRQLLLANPLLFRRVSSISQVITRKKLFSYDILRNLLLAIIRASALQPVICVIHGGQDCDPIIIDRIVDLARECRRLTSCSFKVVILSEGEEKIKTFEKNHETYGCINLGKNERSMIFLENYSKARTARIVEDHQQWHGLNDEIFQKLYDNIHEFNYVSLVASLLETTNIASTQNATHNELETLPTSLEGAYSTALGRSKANCGLPLVPLLKWVSSTVRPLIFDELAVISALASNTQASLDGVASELPKHISYDLEMVNKTIWEVSGQVVQPKYGEHVSRNDHVTTPDRIILSWCLNYLESALTSYAGSFHSENNIEELIYNKPELALLEYVVVEWPQHYLRALPDTESLDGRILGFFASKENIQAWFNLFQHFTWFPTERCCGLDSMLKLASWLGLLTLARGEIQRIKKESSFQDQLTHPLDLASASGQQEVVALLLNEGAQSSEAMGLAADGGHLEIVQAIHDLDPAAITKEDRWKRPPLVPAVVGGNDKVVKYLLDKNADPRVVSGDDMTLLLLASEMGHTDIAGRLLNAGVDVKAKSKNDCNALHLSAQGGFDDIVCLLLRNDDVDKEGICTDGKTALHLAITNGHVSTVELLLNAGANVHQKTKDGLSPIHLAAEAGFLEILRSLIKLAGSGELKEAATFSKQDTNKRGIESINPDEADLCGQVIGDEESSRDQTADDGDSDASSFDMKGPFGPLHLAARNGHIDIVQELLAHQKYSSDRDRSTALILVSGEGFVDIVRELVSSRITTAFHDNEGNTALHIAAERQHFDIVEQLLNPPAVFDITAKNKSGQTPLHLAAMSGRLITVKILIHRGAPVEDKDGVDRTVFHLSASNGHSNVFQYLFNRLDKNARHMHLTTTDSKGDTPLTLAVQGGHLCLSQFMLDWCSSFPKTLESLQGEPGVLIAAYYRHIDIARLLLEKGFDVNDHYEDILKFTALHWAIFHQDVPMTKLLLEWKANPNVPDSQGQSPLHLAAKSDAELVRVLLDHESTEIDLTDMYGATPLGRASSEGKVGCVEELLKSSPNLELRETNERGWSALHAAHDFPEIISLLLTAGADPMSLSGNRTTPFMLVAGENFAPEILPRFIEHEAKIDINAQNDAGETALFFAVRDGMFDTVKLLVENGACTTATNRQGETALHHAALHGRLGVCEYLLKEHSDVGCDWEFLGTLLISAAKSGHESIVRLLLDKGARINFTSDTHKHHSALQAAACQGVIGVVKLLLESKADPNAAGGSVGSPLCAAVKSDSLEIVALLLDKGADINYAQGPKGTALEYSVSKNHLDIATLLLERGAGVNIVSPNKKHGTPLIAAIHKDFTEAVQLLLKYGADPNIPNPEFDNETPAKAAIINGRHEIFKLLLEKRVRLSFKDKRGRGPLSTAIINRSFELLPSLLSHEDINVNEVDFVGRTPLILATLQGVDVIEELHRHEAKLDIQDRWGRTALMHAIIRDYTPLVTGLIEREASLFLRDIRDHDALYWASRRASLGTFNAVLEKLKDQGLVQGFFQEAASAATVLKRAGIVEQLLNDINYDFQMTDTDGWTVMDTALRYRDDTTEQTIQGLLAESTDPQPKLPTEWHPKDMSPALFREPDKVSLTMSDPVVKLGNSHSLARANHPMWPQQNEVYYFEVTINNGGNGKSHFTIGFCEEHVPLSMQLGSSEGSWGYRGDNGCIYDSEGGRSTYGPPYAEGSVIGCGVNFHRETAFFTLDGQVLGQAFSNIRGKLYPAISVGPGMAGCMLSARFWDIEAKNNDKFMFQGSLDDQETFTTEREQHVEIDEDGSTSAGSTDSSFTDDS